MMSLQQALAWVPGGVLIGDPATRVKRVHTDTRSLQAGDLFVALRGERFDANAFVAEARAKGAAAALTQRGVIPAGYCGIEVDDSKQALGALAAGWRSQFRIPLIAVTGSNGKTTVTQMIASILRAWKGDGALATQGNLNNDIGVPLTLLRLRGAHQVAVIELGMNHPGEIGYLADLVRPTVALVNNAQREHQEFMASVEAVALENSAVFDALAGHGTAVFPAHDTYASLWRDKAGPHAVLTFADSLQQHDADVRGEGVWRDGRWLVQGATVAGAVSYSLGIAGRHNVLNSLAAIACALAAGVPMAAIAQGLTQFEPVKGRSSAWMVTVGSRTLTVVDDTYNANPDSVRAAIDVLAELPGPHLLVLGDMGEVGQQGEAFHAEVGAHARASGIGRLFTLGDQAVAMQGQHFASMAALNAAVLAQLPQVSSVLVKGSRFMKMERVVQAITAHAAHKEEKV
ncbi:MAG: UDP-N-acetylmuramoylalanyl-D-glutamyl-2, 6-diaminopimelate--D-alanyl-D-alanine ligase [Betaproteobacteria bacterium HGW-Betaproteobacteria-3]|jgi:UDP-N-acetylmuramoyl-tripeptide--D-alanyl-D-alanine ligase|nr:MAG: UDP-N-acetylmuramoylalanyl-D-glutamyl-2, 6-diaminopimelate--D-alanyl-D-alanine ligase [Betaproteobacteria bacterium HGW-Betaproteobacteria-3]